MKWELKKLSDCCTSIADGDHQAPPKADSGLPFVTISNINTANQFDFTNTMFVPHSYYDSLDSKRKAQEGDILYSVVGSFGIPVYMRETIPFVFQRHIAILRPNSTILPQFLYYTMLSRDFYMMADAAAIGAAQRTVSLTALRNMKIAVPQMDIQKRIVNILSTYDSLIENSQKQIKLLEEAAQRLYKEWFIDLRFPGHETTPVVDGVPEGWESTALENICALNKQVLAPADIPPNVPYIGLEHMPRKDICLCEWGTSSEVSSSKLLYQEKDIIFGKIRPYFHKVGFALNSGIASTDSIIMRANKDVWGLLLMTVSSVPFVDYVSKTCKEGSKMPRADWNQMKAYPVLIPNEGTRERFESNVGLITDEIQVLALQNRCVSEARDRLLPRLMSGEIEV